MQTLPNQESLLQNQVFLAAQYSSTYLRFPYYPPPHAGEGREGVSWALRAFGINLFGELTLL
jgi:hypothetical protein